MPPLLAEALHENHRSHIAFVPFEDLKKSPAFGTNELVNRKKRETSKKGSNGKKKKEVWNQKPCESKFSQEKNKKILNQNLHQSLKFCAKNVQKGKATLVLPPSGASFALFGPAISTISSAKPLWVVINLQPELATAQKNTHCWWKAMFPYDAPKPFEGWKPVPQKNVIFVPVYY